MKNNFNSNSDQSKHANITSKDVRPLLGIEDLRTYFFTYNGIAKAVDGVSLSLKAGETLGIVGESGCGKSVTGLSILRLVPGPYGKIVGGKILFDGYDILKLSKQEVTKLRGSRISMIFQEPMTSLNPVFTVGEQISEILRFHKDISRRDALNRSVELLKLVGIPSPELRVRDYPYQLSGGMRQRIIIAMAVSCDPQLIIADEPTTALDVTIQCQILDLLQKLQEQMGTAIILITHDLGVVAENVKKVAVMYTGRVVELCNVTELFKNPFHPYTIGLLEAVPKIGSRKEKLNTIPGVVPNVANLPDGCKFSERCSASHDKCYSEEPELLDCGSDHFVRCWKYLS